MEKLCEIISLFAHYEEDWSITTKFNEILNSSHNMLHVGFLLSLTKQTESTITSYLVIR